MKMNLILLWIVLFFSGCEKIDINTDYTTPDKNGVEKATEQIHNADWRIKELSDNITWKYVHFDNLFASKQSITLIEINLNDNGLVIDIPYVTSGFLKTSEAATESNATAAINGSFFNTSTGGSTVFFKKDGSIINYTRDGFDAFRENAGFSISLSGDVSVIKKPEAGWASTGNSNTLLASGPLLVFDGEPVSLLHKAFNTDSHPRTAIGVTDDNRLIAIVVDGRASEAAGMTNAQLATVMDALGCEKAMNLDGGGSSTAWIKGEGVVNYPSDNEKFDHEGERGVATVISFITEE